MRLKKMHKARKQRALQKFNLNLLNQKIKGWKYWQPATPINPFEEILPLEPINSRFEKILPLEPPKLNSVVEAAMKNLKSVMIEIVEDSQRFFPLFGDPSVGRALISHSQNGVYIVVPDEQPPGMKHADYHFQRFESLGLSLDVKDILCTHCNQFVTEITTDVGITACAKCFEKGHTRVGCHICLERYLKEREARFQSGWKGIRYLVGGLDDNNER